MEKFDMIELTSHTMSDALRGFNYKCRIHEAVCKIASALNNLKELEEEQLMACERAFKKQNKEMIESGIALEDLKENVKKYFSIDNIMEAVKCYS